MPLMVHNINPQQQHENKDFPPGKRTTLTPPGVCTLEELHWIGKSFHGFKLLVMHSEGEVVPWVAFLHHIWQTHCICLFFCKTYSTSCVTVKNIIVWCCRRADYSLSWDLEILLILECIFNKIASLAETFPWHYAVFIWQRKSFLHWVESQKLISKGVGCLTDLDDFENPTRPLHLFGS